MHRRPRNRTPPETERSPRPRRTLLKATQAIGGCRMTIWRQTARPDSSCRRWTSMTGPGQPRGRTLSAIRGAHRQGRCARMSALDRHTPRPTLPCSCSTTARNGCGARRGIARHPYGFHAGAPDRSAASSGRWISSGVRIHAPPSRYIRGVMCPTAPHDGQVQLRLFDRDPAGVEEVLRVRKRRVLRAPQRPVLIDVGEQPRQDVEQRPIQSLLDLRRAAVE